MMPYSPGVRFVVILLLGIGVTHLLRPSIWRETILTMARSGVPGVTLYGVMHVLPGALLVALTPGASDLGSLAALSVGCTFVAKGIALILFADRADSYLVRCCEKGDGAWRLPGATGVLIAIGIVLASGDSP